MQLTCPDCGSIIYSRRAELCGVCGKALPESYHFHGHQAEVLETELDHAREGLKKASNMSDENLPGGVSTEMDVG